MNYLVTLNNMNYLTPNVRNSYKFACERWGIGYHEITINYNPTQDLCFNKILGIRDFINNHSGVRGILYMDADMLIRSDTPNPFELFSDRKYVYTVKDFDSSRWDKLSDSYINIRDEVAVPWITKCHSELKWNIPIIEIENCIDWFFNAGLFLIYVPESLYEIDLFISNIPEKITNSRNEQALWNYILKYRNKIKAIDSTWNRINPEIEDGIMKSYIYHFTGVESFCKRGKRKERIFNWKI